MALQNNRIVRFIIMIGIVILTIFIYASYYSYTPMSIPIRIHSTAALVSSVSNGNVFNRSNYIQESGLKNIYLNDNKFNFSSIEIFETNQKLNEFNIKKNQNEKNNTNLDDPSKIVYEGAISNIQSIIKNADKILKNLTTLNFVNPVSRRLNLKELMAHNKKGESIPKYPSSTGIKVPVEQHENIPNNLANLTSIQLDLSSGVPTGQIYEGGHLDVNPNLCPNEGDQIKLLIVITSAPAHREARLAIRQTWGHYGVRRDITIGFILGRSINTVTEEFLDKENYIYGDLIRGRFIDSYNNLTLKTISVLEWVDKQCPLINYVLKTDDDMFINVPKLLSFIDKQKQKSEKRVIYGRLAKKWKPIRNKKSKYYVAPGQFSQTVFPQFTTGPAYLMSSDIIHELLIKALEQTYLKLEDVFTTGIVAQLLNIKRVHVNEFLNRRIAFNPCNIRKAISVHMIKSNEQFDLWKKLLDTSTKCK